MVKYLIATHGEMAEGMKSTLKLLTGERTNLEFLSFYCDKYDALSKLREFFEKNKDCEIVAFTDLLGGSVNQEVLKFVSEKVHIIAGFNMAVILEIILSMEETIESNRLEEIIETAKEQLVYVNKIISTKEEV
ncbi:PTS sugar transporter subunit IIA [Clostridium oryzae]|uniref:PTS system fructose IIA component n=1 Tax=Clostridium oryzae TaxID=1450648 RepID=A0A1V4IZS5_9CLOT|nr:hypothetical protein [Clostridium oryzae]OPJ64917.1 PTS system fructose IIA component [Clostridium oryzae]